MLNTIRMLTVLLASLAVAGLSWGEKVGEIIDIAVDRGGIKYEVGSGKPFTGKAVAYYENGQKRIEFEYRDGKKDGKWITWYENGKKKLEGEYRDGEILREKCWDEDGNPANCEDTEDIFSNF